MEQLLNHKKNKQAAPRLVKWTLLALAAFGAVGLWQLAPAPTLAATAPAVDANLTPGALIPSSFADVIDAVKPSVVNITTTAPAMSRTSGSGPLPFPPGSPFEEFFRQFGSPNPQAPRGDDRPMMQGAGSGFIIDPSGYVVTNNHVVDDAESIAVTLDDGTRYDAELLGVDPKTDLALLKVEADEALPYVRFGDSDETRIGDWVIAIGNPFGLGGTATTGIVSARGRDIQSGPYDDFLQIDAPINRGNSGGPLFDMSGRVVGINTAIYSPNGGSVGIGFAIPSELAETVIDQLRSSGHVERGWLGVEIQGVDETMAEGLGLDDAHGALVARVVPDSPAAEAGLQAGDVIVGVGGERVETLKDVTRGVAARRPGEKLEIEVWRQGDRETLDVVTGNSLDSEPVARSGVEGHQPEGSVGISLAGITPEARAQFGLPEELEGALIVAVEAGSPAAARGIRVGDVILMVGQKRVANLDEAIEAINEVKAQKRGNLLLQISRGNELRFLTVPLS